MSKGNSLSLPEAYKNPAVRAFGKALRIALSFHNDYASLMDFEAAETPDAFGEAVKKFLRRNYNRNPTEKDLDMLMSLVNNDNDVRILRSAIISYGLTSWEKKEKEQKEKEEGSEA